VGRAFDLPKGRIFAAIEQNEIPKLSNENGQEARREPGKTIGIFTYEGKFYTAVIAYPRQPQWGTWSPHKAQGDSLKRCYCLEQDHVGESLI
jgi:hypothetical protein